MSNVLIDLTELSFCKRLKACWIILRRGRFMVEASVVQVDS